MKRLIKKGLMFGNLVAVDSPALVERYNRALKHLTGRETKLTDFYIDISGYSLEIGEELKDPLYLNPNGCNRQFILLSIAQKTAPLLNAKFSSARQILRDYIDLNEAELFALTARDAVAGELVNSIYDLSDPARLFDIRRIKVEADTTGNTVAEAKILAEKIDRFKNEEDAWFDDVLIAQMIELASETGDVLKNPIALTPLSVDEQNFWTSHFGGLYIFRDVEHPAAISVEPSEALGSLPIAKVFDLTDRNAVARFLELNELVEPIVRARGIDAAAVLGQKMDFILVDVAAELGHDVGHASRRDLRMLAQKIGADLPAEFHGLAALKRWAESGGAWPKISSENPAYFYTLRARPGPVQAIVNQLLSELSPLDIRQLFICHKELFYKTYRGWSTSKRGYVADYLEREYQIDKAGAREALFGGASMEEPDPEMSEKASKKSRKKPAEPWGKKKPDIIDLVGPWGPVLKGRK
ncbi:MAG: hypothetical protein ACJA06_001753 [Halocynthiibacter sp.]